MPTQFAAPRFATGTEIALLERGTGEVAELVRVAVLDRKRREFGIEGYTARFSAETGAGLPLVERAVRPTCEVLDMSGRVLRPRGESEADVVRRLEPRFDARPATAADRRAVTERDETLALGHALTRRIARATRRGEVDLQTLRRVEELLGAAGRPDRHRAAHAGSATADADGE